MKGSNRTFPTGKVGNNGSNRTFPTGKVGNGFSTGEVGNRQAANPEVIAAFRQRFQRTEPRYFPASFVCAACRVGEHLWCQRNDSTWCDCQHVTRTVETRSAQACAYVRRLIAERGWQDEIMVLALARTAFGGDAVGAIC